MLACRPLAALLALLVCAQLARSAPQSRLVGWGSQWLDSTWNEERFELLAVGVHHTMGLRADGTVAAWGYNYSRVCEVPVPPPGRRYVRLDGGSQFSPGLLDDDELQVPSPPAGLVYVAVHAGRDFTAAQLSDGFHAQIWFRDPGAASGSGLSDGLEVSVCP